MKVSLGTVEPTERGLQQLWWWHFGNKYCGNPKHCPKANKDMARSHILTFGRTKDEELGSCWTKAVVNFDERQGEHHGS